MCVILSSSSSSSSSSSFFFFFFFFFFIAFQFYFIFCTQAEKVSVCFLFWVLDLSSNNVHFLVVKCVSPSVYSSRTNKQTSSDSRVKK